jgi:DNA/RNA-binding domain of Phe-tRNA-synthetase-like protein
VTGANGGGRHDDFVPREVVDAGEDTVLAPETVAPEVLEELPGLELLSLRVQARPSRSPQAVKERLRMLSDRIRGAEAIVARQRPIPWAYRVLYRHVGLDPDADRTPVESAILRRLFDGRFAPEGLPADALTVAVVETGVPVWALDSERVTGRLELRPARAGEQLGRGEAARPVRAGRLVIADDDGPVAMLFGQPSPPHAVTRATTRMTLFTVRPAAVPALHLEEAFWTVLELLAEAQ